MTPQEEEDLRQQLHRLKRGIRDIAHDISNPLGVLQMAVYYLQRGKPDREKQEHYYAMIAQTVDKVESSLMRLRALSENPMLDVRADNSPDTPKS